MDFVEEVLNLHKDKKGKFEIKSKLPVRNQRELSLAYTPGVAEPCKEIHKDKNLVYDYTSKGNLVAVVSDGTAVLGLGNIGPEAAMPVMEGKSILFKEFAAIDALPVCLNTTDVDKIVETVKLLEPTFGGINLEDIAAPACFEIEKRLKESMDIPIFHDDQHGTAIVVLAGITNALRLLGKNIGDIKVVVNGAGAAATAVSKLLLNRGVNNLIICDRQGAIYKGRTEDMDKYKSRMSELTNKDRRKGTLKDIIKDADVFIGLSAGKVLSKEMVSTMAKDPIVFAMANPVPEILPEDAKKGGAKIIATGRSDFPNQINNVLAFPAVFRGALDVRAKDINEEMKIAAAEAIADIIKEEELHEEYIIPDPFDLRVVPKVAVAVAKAARDTGVAQLEVDLEYIESNARKLILKEENNEV
ncbi:NAD(P)-dependent malic enzyme [Clostridiisalibacter paucivorans]|uniref:NAD(P)-dependent malic enzyme n=1 Tax=Clostridiisalibacter paucivorans TaxID=408753 RepID=UPI00047C5109|nr:malic enzyme-like NAD(P)-binding protein [Clostridiisalibacter paucivorans]